MLNSHLPLFAIFIVFQI